MVDNRFLDRKKLPEEKHEFLLKAYMKVNSNLEIVSQIVANDLDTFDKHHQYLALEAMTKSHNHQFIIDGNGGEGKTTFAFRLAAGLGAKGYLVFFTDLIQQSSTLTRDDIKKLIWEMDRESGSELQKSFLFIDNPCANPNILGWIHDEVVYRLASINIVLVERVSRLKLLFNFNTNDFPEWEAGMFRIRLRNTARKQDGQSCKEDELWINRSFSMRKSIIKKMIGTIEGINAQIVNIVFRTSLNDLMQDNNMTVVEAMFYFKFKYNEILREKNLPISKRIPLDWDEWNDLINKNAISRHFSYGYIAAPYLFSYQFPVLPITQESPDFLSIINTMNQKENVEPLIYDKGRRRLYPKHEAAAEMYFQFCNIDDITGFLTSNFHRFSAAMKKVFIHRVMRKQYILENSIGNLHVNFDKVLETISSEDIFAEMPDQLALIHYWTTYKGDQSDITGIRKLTVQYPNNEDIWKEYINICVQYNYFDECEKGLKNLLANENNYWNLRFAAEIYLNMSNTEQAVKYFYAASKKSLNRLKEYRKIEKILEESGIEHGLSRVRQRIIEMDYRDLRNYKKLDSALMAEGKTDDCFRNYEYAQYYFPDNSWGYERMIELALNLGYYGKAFRNIKKYFLHFHLKKGPTQLKLLRYWVLMCWCDDKYCGEVRQIVLRQWDHIIAIWEKEENPGTLRWILLLCLETGLESMLSLTNSSHVADKDEMIAFLKTINLEFEKSFETDSKVLWPTKYLYAVFNESKVYFRGQTQFWHSFIRFVFRLFEKLRNVCNHNPCLEKTLYWDMKPQMQKWTLYAMQRFLAKDQTGLDEILSCTVEYEIILFLAPFHWFENYFEGRVNKEKKLAQIFYEKGQVLSHIHKIYLGSIKMLLADGQAERANQLLNQIVERYPRTAQYLVLYITSFILLNKSKEVYYWYLYLLNLSKHNVPNKLFYDVVNYYINLGDWETADKILEVSESIISNRKQIKICEMQVYFKKGDLDRAEQIALELQKDGISVIQNISILYQIYCNRGNMQKAQEMVYYGIKQFPQSDTAYLNLADYFCKTGEKEKSLKICLKKINRENPDILKMGKELCCECGQFKIAVKFYYRYCKCMRKRTSLERLPYHDIAEGLFSQGKWGLLKKFLKNIRRHHGYEGIMQTYMSKINQKLN